MDETLRRARDAALRHAWREAVTLFEELRDEGLSPEDLGAKADALWWTCRVDESMVVRQKAYAAFAASGDRRKAAYHAWFLSVDHALNGEESLSTGWLMRAMRDLEGEPPCLEQGLVLLEEAGAAFFRRGDTAGAERCAREALALGRRIDDAGLMSVALERLGHILVADGRVEEGAKLLDEGMVSVLTGGVTPFFTGMLYCEVLSACVEIGDVRRAVEWSEAAVRWSSGIPDVSPFHGICRLHHVEVQTLRGAWDEAEAGALRTSAELATMRPDVAAGAVYALGEINRLRGNLPAAEQEFSRAHGLGHDPQPGLALVRLAQGNTAAAAAALRLPLQRPASSIIARVTLLSAQVEVCLAAGNAGGAHEACKELEDIAARWESPLLQARALAARAACLLLDADPAGAAGTADRACRLLGELHLRHESALARLLLGLASRAAGDEERARLEFAAAEAEFEALGARLDARRAADLLEPSSLPRGLSEREIQVLRMVASGKTNKEIAAELVLSEHTVSRHLQNIFRKLGVSSRAAATAFAFENSLV